jgi:hypothetical protein
LLPLVCVLVPQLLHLLPAVGSALPLTTHRWHNIPASFADSSSASSPESLGISITGAAAAGAGAGAAGAAAAGSWPPNHALRIAFEALLGGLCNGMAHTGMQQDQHWMVG